MRQQRFSGCGLLWLVCPEHAHEKQQRTYNNGAIGNVERRPVMHADIEIQKVRDFAVKRPIPEIAHGPAQNQRERQRARVEDAALFP